MHRQETLNAYILQSLRSNWELLALTDFNGASYQYKDVARKITKLHILFKNSGVEKGDKIAICGRNSAQWAMAFIGIITYGAVAVPVLNEFKPDNIHHLVNHSGARLLFADASTWENLDAAIMPALEGALLISDFSLLMSRSESLSEARANLNKFFGDAYPERFTVDDVEVSVNRPDDVALINYTSGSTGFSKGVMVTNRNLWSNLEYTVDHLDFLSPGDGIVCMLPLAHMYGLLVEMLHPFIKGCHINFLTRTPSPRIIMEAFANVRPKLIVAVPLILEKIIRTKVFPLLEKPYMKLLLHVPFVDDRLLAKIKTKLTDSFGGNLVEIIIGGAALNKDVESFLRRIDFPFTVGYGMTECAPLISYAPHGEARAGSCGKVVDRMEVRVESPDAAEVPGVLWVRGDNVMKGYYKNDEATAEVFDADGWMCTGDIGCVDADNFIYLRGRDKNMILGPSGQNIYPEEIEQKLNNMPYVGESIVIDEGGRLVALVYPDMDNVMQQRLSAVDIERLMSENMTSLNKELPGYSQIARIDIMSEEFEKTPKRSIKRYLYQR
ncbi:MAG: AMP-binding protein [Paramuribaculum sp.]|nr:AMP-binding protein [Paramuribaculum sp.]